MDNNLNKDEGGIAMKNAITRKEAIDLLKKYNKEPFHILHALTVEGVMRWYSEQLGYSNEAEYWGIVGLLHDIDFEMWPEEHCVKATELLREANASDEMIYSICSHGYGICVEIKPNHTMEKVLFATDELTGLIGAAARMRPSKSVMDMELSSLKKKFKDKKFASGCSRDVIKSGAELLEWNLDELLEKTIFAMRSCEEYVNEYMKDCE
jgi:predicted hydrolase (HD superfamily)